MTPVSKLGRKGSVALIVGLATPTLMLLVMGGLDCANIVSDHARARTIAEAAALAGARDLGVATGRSSATERAKAFADAQIAEWKNGPRLTAASTLVEMAVGGKGVHVQIDGRRPSFFGTLLPPGGWHFSASAVATAMGSVPLCVLAHGDGFGKVLEIKDTSRLAAPSCLIHSNEDIRVESGADIEAMAIQAATNAEGPIDPDPVTDAPLIEDPFKALPIQPPTGCASASKTTVLLEHGEHALAAGLHCAKIELKGTASLQLAAGEHWFVEADFIIEKQTRVTGTDVVLFFDAKSKFEFKDEARVSLEGRDHGQYAGFVLAATRDNDKDFLITSDNVETMHGVIYIPNAQLIIEGKQDVGRESAWTVLIAQRLQLKGNPTLFVNADYQGSDVPVPEGVGPRRAGSRLVR